MLTRELMGVLCLGVVWVTALLVAAAALQDLRDLRRMAKRRVIVGVAEGDLAEWTVQQTARALDADGDEVIAFHDRGWKSEIFGGVVRDTEGHAHEVEATDLGQVWVSEEARVEATGCADVAAFDEVYAQARKAKGHARDVKVRISKGDRVFLVSQVKDAPSGPVIVSTVDPRVFCSRKALPLILFIPLELGVCGLATWLALRLPHFGHASIAGALCCFAFFLGVTPVAVGLREGIRRPHEAFLRRQWSRAAHVRNQRVSAQGLTQRKT
jgi:hypothetical protein